MGLLQSDETRNEPENKKRTRCELCSVDDDDGRYFRMCKKAKLMGRECETAFFASLLPYERARWLYAMKGLWEAGLAQADVLSLILVDMMYVSCPGKWGARIVPPLTERVYMKETHGVALYEAMERERRELIHRKVWHEHDALVAQGVPRERLGLLCANDNPRDGHGAVYDYDCDVLKACDHEDTLVVFPLKFLYVCVDTRDHATICQYLTAKLTDSKEEEEEENL